MMLSSGLEGCAKSPHHCCSVESVPTDAVSSERDLFAVGVYELDEGSGLRNGSIALYDGEDMLCVKEMGSGVLDMKFNGRLLACAMSSGDVDLVDMNLEEGAFDFDRRHSLQDHRQREEGLALSIDWSNRVVGSGDADLAVSTQAGSVWIHRLKPDGFELLSSFNNVHTMFGENMPAWITAFNPHNSNVLLSGGDDCCLKVWDMRAGDTPVHSVGKYFTAGVTSAQWCPYRMHEYYFAAGSYDGNIAVWDERFHSKQPLASLDSGGGVWRLKWQPRSSFVNESSSLYLGAACMHNGAGVYKLDCNASAAGSGTGDDGDVEDSHHAVAMTATCQNIDDNEDRLVYGMDWLNACSVGRRDEEEKESAAARSDEQAFRMVTCSFYDNMIQIWKAK